MSRGKYLLFECIIEDNLSVCLRKYIWCADKNEICWQSGMSPYVGWHLTLCEKAHTLNEKIIKNGFLFMQSGMAPYIPLSVSPHVEIA